MEYSVGAKVNLKQGRHRRANILLCTIWPCLLAIPVTSRAKDISYEKQVLPLLERYCFDCHGDGASKGGLSLDSWKSPAERVADLHVWKEVLRNVSLKVMPPAKRKVQPAEEERALIEAWIFDTILIIPTPEGLPSGGLTARNTTIPCVTCCTLISSPAMIFLLMIPVMVLTRLVMC
jgi:hypothetical protein